MMKDEYKDVIINSLAYLSDNGKIDVFGFYAAVGKPLLLDSCRRLASSQRQNIHVKERRANKSVTGIMCNHIKLVSSFQIELS